MHTHADNTGCLPPAARYGKDGQPLLSWRVLLLPYLERNDLYQRFHLDEPWDSPHNLELLEEMPDVYRRPTVTAKHDQFGTLYQVFVGKGTVFESERGHVMVIPANYSNWIMIVEAADPVPWTKPVDLTYAADQPLAPLGGLFKNRGFRPFSKAYPVLQAAFVDGHVENLAYYDEAKIRTLIMGQAPSDR